MTPIFKSITAAAAGLAFLMAGSAVAQESVTVKVSLFTPPPGPQNILLREINEQLKSDTDGRLQLQLFEASQMGPPTRQFDLVRTGVADMSFVLLGVTPGRFPLTQIGELPGMVGPGISGAATKPISSAILAVSDDYLLEEYTGTKLLNVSFIPNPLIFTAKKIESLDQISGLRLRHPSAVHAEMLEALDGIPRLMNPLEISEALARGQVDGALTSYSGVQSWNLQESVKHALILDSGGLAFALMVNREFYDSIPDDLREVFDKYFGPAAQNVWGTFMGKAEKELRAEYVAAGIEEHELSTEDQAEFQKMVDALHDETIESLEQEGKPARAFYDDVTAILKTKR